MCRLQIRIMQIKNVASFPLFIETSHVMRADVSTRKLMTWSQFNSWWEYHFSMFHSITKCLWGLPSLMPNKQHCKWINDKHVTESREFYSCHFKRPVCSFHISYLCNIHRNCGTIAYFWHFCTWLLPSASWVLEMVKVLPISQEQHLLHLNLCVSYQERSSVFH